MNGQRSSLYRGTLTMLLCAILLSTIFCTTVLAGRHDAATGREDPSASQTLITGETLDPDGASPADGGGTGDPPNEGDPDDYDKIIVQFIVTLMASPVILGYIY